MRRIRKCFKSGNPQVVLRALDLTDTLMQSCGAHARREVGSDKFLKLVGKLCKVSVRYAWSCSSHPTSMEAGGKFNGKVAERRNSNAYSSVQIVLPLVLTVEYATPGNFIICKEWGNHTLSWP